MFVPKDHVYYKYSWYGFHLISVWCLFYRFYLISQGEEWRKARSVFDKQMLKPSHVATYSGKVYGVNADFLRRLRSMRREDMSVPNMDRELFNWSLES